MEDLEKRVYDCEMNIKDLRNDINNNTNEDKAFRKYIVNELSKINGAIDSFSKWQKRQTITGVIFKTILVVAISGVGNALTTLVGTML